MKIIFMGTPEFAVVSLAHLIKNNFKVVAVITAPDRPAGRGQKIRYSAIKEYSLTKGLKILQPTSLKDENFIAKLKELNADLQVVVAFRMLPKIVWDMPRYGTINLHASILPQYRGAAPINWAIINGEKQTGVTTFFINEKIDTGNIIEQQKVEITAQETAGTLHDKLMNTGAKLLQTSIESIKNNNYKNINQKNLLSAHKILHKAPKIFKDDCKIDWNNDIKIIDCFIRGMSPYPTAWTILHDKKTDKKYKTKLFDSEVIVENHKFDCGTIITDNKKSFKIAAKNGYIKINTIQVQGKKKLSIKDFLNGFNAKKIFFK